MSEASFVKLADLLRPAILENERFGSEYHVMYPGTWYTSTVRSLSPHPKAVPSAAQLRCNVQHSLGASPIYHTLCI